MEQRSRWDERGTSLLETLIATAICTSVMFALAALISFATKQNKNMGTTVAQTATLAAQKLDELMQLQWTSATMDPALATGGSLTTDVTTSPGYVDYLDASGAVILGGSPNSVNYFFTRRWTVADVGASGTVKQITVLVFGNAIGAGRAAGSTSVPQTTLACYKVQE